MTAPRTPQADRRTLVLRRLGRVAYAEALELQAQLVTERQQGAIPDTLLLLQHDPVVTLGRTAKRDHLLLDETGLRRQGVALFDTGRGGDVTWHGPGQVVGYPIVDLSPDRRDVHRYVRDLEEVMIRTCLDYGVAAERVPGLTGCWVGDEKIGAIGVRISRWVTSHGFAFNVSPDLAGFALIVPCGIRDRGVTSLERLLGNAPATADVEEKLAGHLADVLARRLA